MILHTSLNHFINLPDVALSLCPQAPVNGDTPPAEGLSENDSGVELTNENSPLTAAEPPSPFSPKQNGDAASPQGNTTSVWTDAVQSIFIFCNFLTLTLLISYFQGRGRTGPQRTTLGVSNDLRRRLNKKNIHKINMMRLKESVLGQKMN